MGKIWENKDKSKKAFELSANAVLLSRSGSAHTHTYCQGLGDCCSHTVFSMRCFADIDVR